MAGHLVVHCIVAQDVPTNGGAPPDLVGPRPTRRYATAVYVSQKHGCLLSYRSKIATK